MMCLNGIFVAALSFYVLRLTLTCFDAQRSYFAVLSLRWLNLEALKPGCEEKNPDYIKTQLPLTLPPKPLHLKTFIYIDLTVNFYLAEAAHLQARTGQSWDHKSASLLY